MPYLSEKGISLSGVVLITALLLFSGCRSVPREHGPYLAPLPADSVLTASLRVKALPPDLNIKLAGLYGQDLDAILERTEELNLSLFEDEGTEVLLEGNFPRFRTSLALGLSSSWERTGRSPDTWTIKDGRSRVSLPKGGQLVYSSLGTTRILGAWDERFTGGLERTNDLVVFIPEMKNLPAGLPLQGEFRIVGTWKDEQLDLFCVWRFTDAFRAKTALPLIKLLLWSFLKNLDPDFDRGALSTRIDGAAVEIRGIRLDSDGIERLLAEYVTLPAQG